MRSVRSSATLKTRVPSALKATWVTVAVCPSRRAIGDSGTPMSKTRTTPFDPAAARRRVDSCTAVVQTSSFGPQANVASSSPVVTLSAARCRRLHPAAGGAAHYETHHSIRTRRAAFIYAPSRTFEDEPPRYRVFDLRADPDEPRDRHRDDEALVRDMKDRLKNAYAIAIERIEGLPVGELDQNAAETMAQLGYLVGASKTAIDAVLFPEDEE